MGRTYRTNVLSRILRSLAFLAFGASTFALVFIRFNASLAGTDSDNLIDLVNIIYLPLKTIGFEGGFLLTVINILSLLVLIWTLNRRLVLQIILTVFTVYLFAATLTTEKYILIGNLALVIPEGFKLTWLTNPVGLLHGIISGTQIMQMILLGLFYVLFWALFAYRKPNRISTTAIRIAILINTIAIILVFIDLGLGGTLMTKVPADITTNIVLLGYGTITAVASLIGALGIARD